MKFPFNEIKATQAASYLLQKTEGRMPHLLLMKILYDLDREALRRWSRPVVGDDYFSMPHGPVMSGVLHCMKGEKGAAKRGAWARHFAPVKDNEIRLLRPASTDHLCEAELELIDHRFWELKRRGLLDKWKMRDFTHTFPEWENPLPKKRRLALPPERILQAVGKSEAQIERVAAEMRELDELDTILA